MLGLMVTITAFSVFNAVQHPDIRQSHFNLMAAFIPIASLAVIDYKVFEDGALDTKSWIAIGIAFVGVFVANLHQICCHSSSDK